jgi:hypothetical protein
MYEPLDNTTPHWPDDGGHDTLDPASFVGTFKMFHHDREAIVDVYVYDALGDPLSQGICLRQGTDHLYSTVRVNQMFDHPIGMEYDGGLFRCARTFLLSRGTFRWQPVAAVAHDN